MAPEHKRRRLLTPPCIIDQVIQPAFGSFLDGFFAGVDTFQLVDFETQCLDANVRQILDGFGRSCCGEDAQAFRVELSGEGIPDAARTAPGGIFSSVGLGEAMFLPSDEDDSTAVCHHNTEIMGRNKIG